MSVSEFNGESGEIVERPENDEEKAQREIDSKANAAAKKAEAKAEADAAAARTAAIAHAKSLGFTDAMIAVMYPNLVAA